MVAQIDEEQLPVVALAMDPAREPDGRAGIGEAELAARMGSVGVHGSAFGKCGPPPPGMGRESALVKPGGRRGKRSGLAGKMNGAPAATSKACAAPACDNRAPVNNRENTRGR